MNNFKEKSQIFIIGIMVGLIIAGGFFVLKLDDYFKKLNFYKTVAKIVESDPKTDEGSGKKEEPVSKEKPTEENKNKTKKVPVDETSDQSSFVMDADTLNNHVVKDSIVTEINPSDDIVVRKDELLSTKTLEVVNLDPTASKMSAKDSLLQKVSGIKDDRMNYKQLFNIEFWSSPLNYKGYKMGKYKLVLYGIASADGMKLFKSDDVIYLKSANMVYKLDYASDFKPYERITDELILNKLK